MIKFNPASCYLLQLRFKYSQRHRTINYNLLPARYIHTETFEKKTRSISNKTLHYNTHELDILIRSGLITCEQGISTRDICIFLQLKIMNPPELNN